MVLIMFLPWQHWHIKFTALGLFKIISSALIMFSRMFERADKFVAFTPYLFVAFTIFLNCDGSLHLGLPLLKGGHCHAQRWVRGFVFLVEKFTYCRLSSSFWISSILGHPTLKPAQMLFFLLGHHENICFLNFLSVSQKWLGSRSSSWPTLHSRFQRLVEPVALGASCSSWTTS